MVFTYSKRFNKFCTFFSSVIGVFHISTFSDFSSRPYAFGDSFSFRRFVCTLHTQKIIFIPIHYPFSWCHGSPKMNAIVQLECCNLEEAKQTLPDTLAVTETQYCHYGDATTSKTTFPTIHEQDVRGLRRNVRTTISDWPIYGIGSRPPVWLLGLSRDFDQSVQELSETVCVNTTSVQDVLQFAQFYSHDIMLPDLHGPDVIYGFDFKTGTPFSLLTSPDSTWTVMTADLELTVALGRDSQIHAWSNVAHLVEVASWCGEASQQLEGQRNNSLMEIWQPPDTVMRSSSRM